MSKNKLQSGGIDSLEKEARDLLRASMVYCCDNPVGTIAASDPNDSSILSYHQVFICDFISSRVALPLKGGVGRKPWIAIALAGQGLTPKSFKVCTVLLDGDEEGMISYATSSYTSFSCRVGRKPWIAIALAGQGLTPTSFKVCTVLLDGDELIAVRTIPWAKLNLNYTAQALIISTDPIIFETVPPIPPPIRTNTGNMGIPNHRVDMMPTNDTNNTTTTDAAQSVVDENLLQLLDARGGFHVTNVPGFDKDDFTSWKVKFMILVDGLEPYLLKTLEKGPFVPMSSLSTSENPLLKRQNQWSHVETRLANQDKRLKTHEGPSDTRDTKIAALRFRFNAFKSLEGEKVNGTFTKLKCLVKDLENNGVVIPQAEVNATFVNSDAVSLIAED
nr:hypothetical protein [Tanacetum cinerariifolium]